RKKRNLAADASLPTAPPHEGCRGRLPCSSIARPWIVQTTRLDIRRHGDHCGSAVSMNYWLVMPAAGIGRRFGTDRPKQYAPLCGRTVIEWALALFLTDPRCAGAVVALAEDDPYWAAVAPATVRVAAGGQERSHSVRNGLAALAKDAHRDDWVLVHDAARPCLPRGDLDRLLAELAAHPVGGLLATPAADTLKRADASRDVQQTIDRAGLWRALTPQMFRYGRLCEALDRA